MVKKILLFFLLSCFFAIGHAAGESPKREMRAGWLTTVYGIDWPYTKSSGAEKSIKAQKEELCNLLDYLKSTNVNTALLQVRSRADALYKSDFEPWSVDLSGARGTDPGYDPLAYAIEEAHKRGMELHTWVNPYRFESVAGAYAGQPGDYATSNPDWVLKIPTDNGYATILDPGNPDVQNHILKIINDIVSRYDIDGVLFDDYFYLSGITNEDASSQSKYRPAGMSVADWRRSNVNNFVSSVYSSIKSIKPYVVFGIGPAGGWTNSRTVAEEYGVTPLLDLGVNVWSQYDDIYCDPLAWLKDKTVDYISPQIYWKTNHAKAPYTPLCKWWSDVANKFGRQIYVSQYLSEIDYVETTRSSKVSSVEIDGEEILLGGLSQIERLGLLSSGKYDGKNLRAKSIPGDDFITQVQNNRDFSKNGAAGSIFYSCNKLRFKSIRDLFVDNVFQNKSIRPATWTPFVEEGIPTNIKIEGGSLKWDYTSDNVRFVVYAIPNSEVGKANVFASSLYLQDVTYVKEYIIPGDKPTSSFTYAVSVLDRYGNEFTPMVYGKSISTEAPVTLLTPADNSKITLPFNFTWKAIDNVDYYTFELAEDKNFTQGIYKRDLTETSLSTSDMDFIKSDKEYYWRIKATKASVEINTSDVWKIQAESFRITSPSMNEVVSNVPTIKWTEAGSATSYILEIANSSSFAAKNMVYDTVLASNIQEHNVPNGKLLSGYTYYVRIAAEISGTKTYSEIVTIKTEVVIPPVPVILTPLDGANIVTDEVVVTWKESPFADSFRVELSTTDLFIKSEAKTISAFTYEATYTGLSLGTYYIRLRANYAISYRTDWSETRKIELVPTSVENEINNNDGSFRVIQSNGDYYLEINLSADTKISAALYNMSGVKVVDILSNQMFVGLGNRIILPDNLQKGIYIINITTEKGNIPIKWIK